MPRRPLLVILSVLFAAAPRFDAAHAMAADRDPSDEAPAGQERTIAADFGPAPLMPARNGGGSTSLTIASWAAPDIPIELLPLLVEAAPFITTRAIPRPGHHPGVERPPKTTF